MRYRNAESRIQEDTALGEFVIVYMQCSKLPDGGHLGSGCLNRN